MNKTTFLLFKTTLETNFWLNFIMCRTFFVFCPLVFRIIFKLFFCPLQALIIHFPVFLQIFFKVFPEHFDTFDTWQTPKESHLHQDRRGTSNWSSCGLFLSFFDPLLYWSESGPLRRCEEAWGDDDCLLLDHFVSVSFFCTLDRDSHQFPQKKKLWFFCFK